jgi:hypothetical protein
MTYSKSITILEYIFRRIGNNVRSKKIEDINIL